MSETNNRLMDISSRLDRLIDLQNVQPAPGPVLPPFDPLPVEPDPAITEAIETNTAGITELRETAAGLGVKADVTTEQIKELTVIAKTTNEAVQETAMDMSQWKTEHGSLVERFNERRARTHDDAATRNENVRAYARDYLEEKMEGKIERKLMLGKVADFLGIPIPIVFGVIGLIVVFRMFPKVRDRIEEKRDSGEPLFIQALVDRLPDKLQTAFEKVGDKLSDKIDKAGDRQDGKIDVLAGQVAEVAAKVKK